MSEEFNFEMLRDYLRGQIGVGDMDVLLDEPWALAAPRRSAAPRVPSPAMARPVPPIPVQQSLQSGAAPSSAPSMFQPEEKAQVVMSPLSMPAARPSVRKTASAFESVGSLDEFYSSIATETVYASAGNLARYEGPANPRLLLLMPAPLQGVAAGAFFQSPVGEMLVRLFASLNVPAEAIGVTYFYKGASPKAISAILENLFRKMLAKELSFIAPQVMVTFGEPLFHQLFGKGKNFNDLAGTDMDFSGIRTCSLVDASAMVGDKQLKWLTWKVHIPKSTYFKA